MDGEIITAKNKGDEFVSLYEGGPEALYEALGPYLFRYEPGSRFGNWYLANGWGQAWGVQLMATQDLQTLQTHFRELIFAELKGTKVFFRFYDPRVLRRFLPTCDAAQLVAFFGPVRFFLVEDEDPTFVLRFWLENGQLRQLRQDVSEVLTMIDADGEDRVEPELSGEGTPPETEQPAAPPDPGVVPSIAAAAEAPPGPKARPTKWNMFD